MKEDEIVEMYQDRDGTWKAIDTLADLPIGSIIDITI